MRSRAIHCPMSFARSEVFCEGACEARSYNARYQNASYFLLSSGERELSREQTQASIERSLVVARLVVPSPPLNYRQHRFIYLAQHPESRRVFDQAVMINYR